MLAIIPEDSKAGKQFWNAVNKEILGGKAILLDRLGEDTDALGFTTILPRLRNAIESGEIDLGWHVLIAIDNLGNLAVNSQLALIKKKCDEHKIHMIVTTYHCIEEVFLSFELLPKWVNTVGNDYIECLSYVRDCIKNGKNYFTNWSVFESQFSAILDKCKANKNREQFAAQLLLVVTAGNSGFKILKNSLGQCWINNCCETEKDVLENSQRIQYYKKICGIPDDGLTAKEKIELINNKSVFAAKKYDMNELSKLTQC